MRRLSFIVLIVMLGFGYAAPSPRTLQFKQDFDVIWKEIYESYAYFQSKTTNWADVQEHYRTRLKSVTTRDQFIALLEAMLDELYDPHTHLNVNIATSQRLMPSGSDMWAAWKKQRAIIEQVRPGSNAERAGLKAGMEVLSIGGAEIATAVDGRLGQCRFAPDPAARDWALRALLAGRHNQQRRIEIRSGDERREIMIDDRPTEATDKAEAAPALLHRRLGEDNSIGYIRINNTLGSDKLVKEFDAALRALKDTAGLILDLRDTPSGGNSTVARGIMGQFIAQDGYYQKHSIPAEERRFGAKRSWMEIVSPRGEFCYRAPVVVLVDHWTGSMGEGMAIGMDGLKRATIVGTRMAGLRGANRSITLPNSRIGASFPVEALFHVNGTPREDFVPTVAVDLLDPDQRKMNDAIMEAGLRTLQALMTDGKSIRR